MLHSFSLKAKLSIFVVLLVGSTGWMITGFVLWHDYRQEQESLRSDGLALAVMLQRVLLDPLRQEDEFHIYELLSSPFSAESAARKRALQHVVLLNDNGVVRASSDPEHIPLLANYDQIEPEFSRLTHLLPTWGASTAPQWFSHDEIHGVYLLVPIGENGVRYGTLLLDYSWQVIFDQFAKRAMETMAVITMMSLLLMLLSHRLAMRFSRPLLRLISEMHALSSARNWGVSSDPHRVDEVARLQDTFQKFKQGLLTAEQQRDEARQWERLALAALNHSSQGVIITTLDANIIYVNNTFCRNVGYTRDEVLGRNPRLLQSGKTPPESYQLLWAALNAGQGWQGELINRRKDGTEYIELLTISLIRREDGSVTHYLAIQEDISERRATEERIRHLAEHDALTGLPNRVLLEDRLAQAIKAAERNHENLALMFVDLDNFKQVNDLLGHHQGDRLLKMAAQRLQEAVRASDTVARLGGDEFVLLAPANQEEALLLATKVVQVLSQPYFQTGGTELSVSASVGISLYPTHGQSAEELTMYADIAMYQAKGAGRNIFCLYEPLMQGKLREHVELDRELRIALVEQQFVLHYQPQFDLQTGEIGGLEALIRWQHPQLGLVYPGHFITAAESSGLIVEIGAWVIDEVCRQIRAWQDVGVATPCVAANVSFKQFHGHDLQGQVLSALERHRLSGKQLELELTESMMLSNPEQVYSVLHDLRLQGIQLSIDDFGSGYSSLMYLKRLDVDTLKIDRAFVLDMHTEKGRAMVETIIKIAQTLGLHTVAEGVETESQLAMLRSLECGEAQGFLLSKPLPAEEVKVLLQTAARHNVFDQIQPVVNFVI